MFCRELACFTFSLYYIWRNEAANELSFNPEFITQNFENNIYSSWKYQILIRKSKFSILVRFMFVMMLETVQVYKVDVSDSW